MDRNSNDLSTEASINKLSFQDSNGLSHIFNLSAASSSITNVQFSLSQRQAAFINEIGVFSVSDDKGTVNGITAGTEGYMQAALTTSRVIFSSLSEKVSTGINFVRQLSFKAGERFGFYLVANDTTSSVDALMKSGKTPDNIFFSLSASNTDEFDHVRVTEEGNTFNLAWEDLRGGGDNDFNDLVLKMEIAKTLPALGTGLQGQKEGEIIDLRSVPGQIDANFTVNNNSVNSPLIGFYRINDVQGTVTDSLTGKTIAPGEVGYASSAIRQSIVSFNQSSTSSSSIETGGLFATYIIVNGTAEQFINSNQNNQEVSNPVAYFTYQKANPDQIQHIHLLGDNTFGFEAPISIGQGEYNYTIFKVSLGLKTDINNVTGGASLATGQTATYTIKNDDATPPSVSITASTTNATEAGTTSAYTISRIGDTDTDLIVNLSIDDSSTVTSNAGGAFGVDYSLSGASISGTLKTRSIIIPVGMSSVNITFTALNDGNAAEASETLKLNLADGDYKIDTIKNNATVTIAANGTGVINTNDDATGTNYTKMQGSLRQALINANTFTGTDNITFNIPTTDTGYTAKTGMYTITLARALDSISDDVNITGLGANKLAVSGNNAVRVFTINSGKTVNIDGLTIESGKSVYGGGLYNYGTLTVMNSTLSRNSANEGGGIVNTGTLTVTNSTLDSNSATSGGGIINTGTLTVTNSTLDSNSATSGGGGGIVNTGTLTVTNSTLDSNSATSGGGGGIGNAGTLTVTNSTLANNSATSGGGIYNIFGATVKAKNTIIAKNYAQNDPDFYGTLTSQGYNLISTTSSNTIITGDTTGDIVNVDPKLDTLKDNGGSTQTIALLSDSLAIDKGDPNFTSAPNTDQRGTGYVRLKNGKIDIGAFEYQFS
ncbi:hypothetical protein NIES4071_09920 [Calothrix sp. NIES-4071]|nr:hypothetical protein NIES4071_09920 [Calothrix sp. NIES-4071]BAZ55334.1 hypothetical protein NIES4105_09880 [Calothrix sp. NIES-4105]